MRDLTRPTSLVTSRGFGKAVATTLVAAGSDVVGIARTPGDLDHLPADIGNQAKHLPHLPAA